MRRACHPMSRLRIGVCLFAAMLFTHATDLGAADDRTIGFSTSVVTLNTVDDRWATVAVDADDHLHLAFQQGLPMADIVYATDASGSWQLTPLTTTPALHERDPSIAVDVHGFVHVVFAAEEGDGRVIRYATNRTGVWQVEDVTAPADAAYYASIGIAPTGRLFVVYSLPTTGVWISHKLGGPWTSHQVTAESSANLPSLAVDRKGTAHIAWIEHFMVAYRACSFDPSPQCSAIEEVAPFSSDPVPAETSITVDGWLRPSVTYSVIQIGGGDSSIHWAHKHSGDWGHWEIDGDSEGRVSTTIALAGDGTPRVVYSEMMAARYGSPGLDSWVTTDAFTADSGPFFGSVDRWFLIDGAGKVRFVSLAGDPPEIYSTISYEAAGPLPASCAVPREIACNSVVSDQTTAHQSVIAGYDCSVWSETGPEVVYSFTVPFGPSDVTASLSGLGADLDLFLLDSDGCSVSPHCLTPGAVGDSSVTLAGLAPGAYFVVVDGFSGASGPFTLSLSCSCLLADDFESGDTEAWSATVP